jgi:hypothetical protein
VNFGRRLRRRRRSFPAFFTALEVAQVVAAARSPNSSHFSPALRMRMPESCDIVQATSEGRIEIFGIPTCTIEAELHRTTALESRLRAEQ